MLLSIIVYLRFKFIQINNTDYDILNQYDSATKALHFGLGAWLNFGNSFLLIFQS